MSTLFAIFEEEPELDEDGCIVSDIHAGYYAEVAYRGDNGQINWEYPFDICHDALKNDVKVYPLDNTPQGIHTIGDIKKAIERNR